MFHHSKSLKSLCGMFWTAYTLYLWPVHDEVLCLFLLGSCHCSDMFGDKMQFADKIGIDFSSAPLGVN